MNKTDQLDDHQISAIIEMAWDDQTPFDAIEVQTGLSEHQVIEIMRANLPAKSFKVWRTRVSGRRSKHAKLCR